MVLTQFSDVEHSFYKGSVPKSWWLESEVILTKSNKEPRMFNAISLSHPENSSTKTIKKPSATQMGIEIRLRHPLSFP